MSALAQVVAAVDPELAPYRLHDPGGGELEAIVGDGCRAFVIEAIREGYLLHYGEPRLLAAADPDLRLLAGDYLYALGLERLAARGDLDAVRELGDLISLSAQVHARNGAAGADDAIAPLWLAVAVAVGSGPSERLERGKSALRDGDPAGAELLFQAAAEGVTGAQRDALAAAAESIGLPRQHLHDRG